MNEEESSQGVRIRMNIVCNREMIVSQLLVNCQYCRVSRFLTYTLGRATPLEYDQLVPEDASFEPN